MGVYGLSSMAFALILTFYTAKNTNRKYIHMFSLILGGLGFIYMYYATESTLVWSFVLIGFFMGSIYPCLMPCYQAQLIQTMGMMMGLFNMFIVIPQIIAALRRSQFFIQTYRNRTHQCYVTCWNLLDPSGNL
jgi:maltose/moltooligosaccharide transporter